MTPTKKLADFLHAYHDDVMACEKKALQAIERGNRELYRAFMKAKAEKMAVILQKAGPLLKALPEARRDEVWHALHRFSNSANLGLRLDSPFYWSALLWNDDAKPGDPDNLLVFVRSLEEQAEAEDDE